MTHLSKTLLALALAACASGSALAAGDADFTLVNKTGYPIREIFASPTRSSHWGADRLGRHVLPDGASRKLRFGDSAHCHQDLQVVFDDDSTEVTWENLNLCELDKVTLRYNRKTGEVKALTE